MGQFSMEKPSLPGSVLSGNQQIEAIKGEIKARLSERFGINHSSLEFEDQDHSHQGADLFGHGASARAEQDPCRPRGEGAR